MQTPEQIVTDTAAALARLREKRPRVHVVTNSVVQQFTANMLLAIGAIPSMTTAAAEIADFAAAADSLLINLGTLDRERQSAIDGAVDLVTETGRPWVLDPVFVDVSPLRCAYAAELARREPRVLRGNARELAALSRLLSDNGGQPAVEGGSYHLTRHLALATVTTVVQTGVTDHVSDGVRHVDVSNGHPYLDQLVGTGCAGGAITAAFLAVETDPIVAAVASLSVIGIAAENAASSSAGPGSFGWQLSDAVSQLSPADIARRTALRVGAAS